MKKGKSKAKGSAVLKDQRCSSGVEGLDDILSGGLPRDCFYLIQGDPVRVKRPWRCNSCSKVCAAVNRFFM